MQYPPPQGQYPAQGQYPPPGQHPPPQPYAPPPKRGISGKMILGIVAGLGCLGVIAFGGFFVLMFFGILGSLKSSDAYQTAHAYFISNPTVMADLGTPIEDGLFPNGSINTAGTGGSADLTFSLSGPRGEGSAHATATRSASGWTLNLTEWTFNGRVTVLSGAGSGSVPSLPAPATP